MNQNNYLKIIFLDIDGVLSGNSNIFKSFIYYKLIPSNWRDSKIIKKFYDPYKIDEKKVKLLAEIAHTNKAKIVLISAWRNIAQKALFNPKTIEVENLKYSNVKLLVEYFRKYKLTTYDVTQEDSLMHRSTEIALWLRKCKKPIYSFVILDDELNEEYMNLNRQVCTCDNPKKSGRWYVLDGLRRKHVKEITNILNKKLDNKSKYTTDILYGGFN